MFFDGDENVDISNSAGVVTLADIIDKTLCSKRLEVTMTKQEDFAFQIKGSESGSFLDPSGGELSLRIWKVQIAFAGEIG